MSGTKSQSLANSRDRALRERAAQVIPNGMYGHQSVRILPENFPQFFASAKGSRIWDTDGNEYLDFMCGYGPNLFGYGNEGIDAAAAKQQHLGDASANRDDAADPGNGRPIVDQGRLSDRCRGRMTADT